MEVMAAAISGDGTVANVGMKLTGHIHCHECNQRFESVKALRLHLKHIHKSRVQKTIQLVQDGDELVCHTLTGDKLLRLATFSLEVGDLLEQIAAGLGTASAALSIVQGHEELQRDQVISDFGSVLVRQE